MNAGKQAQGGEVVAYIYKERYGHDDSAWIERINRTLPAWEHKDVQPLYTAPPSAPVGVELPPAAERVSGTVLGAGFVQSGDWAIPSGSGGARFVDERMAYGWNECRKAVQESLAQQPAAVDGSLEGAILEVVESINRFRSEGTRPHGGTLTYWEATLRRALAAQPGGGHG